MSPELEKAWDQQEAIRQQLLQRIRRAQPNQQIWRSAPDVWSMADVCRHLMVAEANGLKYLRKKSLAAASLPANNVNARFRIWLLKIVLKAPFKYKAPKAAAISLDQSVSFEQVEKDWNAIRADWKKFLEEFPREWEDKLIFKHPVAGMFNLKQTMEFLGEHINHHIAQVERIEKHQSFPK